MRTFFFVSVFVVACSTAACEGIFAQTYPARPIKLIIPYATGGGPDIIARLLGQELMTSLGATVAENRPGASGNLGADLVAKSAPDGYTLLVTTTATQSINPALYPNVPYNPLKDFTAVSLVAFTPVMLVVSNGIPAKNLSELLALAKVHPGELSYASAGPGSMQHIAAELLASATGIQLVHVPYKGTSQIIPDIIAGRVSMMINSIAAVLPLVKDRKLRPIAVASRERSAAAPDVPTFAEAGLPGFEASAWYAVFGPAGLPPDIVKRLNAEIGKAVRNERIHERFAQLGLEPATSTPEELADIQRRDLLKYTRLIKEKNIRAE
jgi:tripartite-type tricarboxylate transporter receptor subunit TctC